MRLAGPRALFLVFVLTLPLVTPRLRAADEIEGFAYLRSLAFDGDLDFGNEYLHFYERDPRGLSGFKATFLDLREPRTGRHINFTPLGSGLLWSPFYAAAHAGVRAARALGSELPADGFSWPYEAAACYASALYGFLGLLLAHACLRSFGGVGEPAASLAVAGVWLGTPLLYYMTIAPGFSHAASVFTVSLLAWLALRLRGREGTRPRDWALVGAAGGLAGLVREQDALFLILPAGVLLAEVWRTRRVGPWLARAAALAAGAFVAFLPQLFAYRMLTGRFGPSRLVARKLSYSSPHFLEVLFDPGHGLLAWSPLLVLACAGLLVALLRRREPVSALLATALLFQVWINGSLESWTQAGAFGSRRFVSSTLVFAWGLAFLVAPARARLGRLAPAAVLAAFAWWNASLMLQFGLKLMDRQRLEWPRVAVNQVTEVPRHFARAAWLFFTDRERLVKEGP